MSALVSVSGLTIRYGRTVAVRHLSFELSAGQLLGLVGPNGAGKTTLLRAVAGLKASAAGSVRILDHRVDAAGDEWTIRRQIGFAPDNPPVYPELTVDQFLTFIGRAYELPPDLIAERIDFWLAQLWLTERRGAPIRSLSRGMRQRVAIARSLLPDPTVILLDEPAAGLDPAGRVEFRRLLGSLRDQGKALIVSSHILADLHEYCTHIAIMQQGAFLRYGSVSEVTHGQAQRTRYRLVLARPTPEAERLLRSDPDVDRLDIDGTEALFDYREDRGDAADLLRRLVTANIQVSSFAPLARDLEEAYLRTGVKQVD